MVIFLIQVSLSSPEQKTQEFFVTTPKLGWVGWLIPKIGDLFTSGALYVVKACFRMSLYPVHLLARHVFLVYAIPYHPGWYGNTPPRTTVLVSQGAGAERCVRGNVSTKSYENKTPFSLRRAARKCWEKSAPKKYTPRGGMLSWSQYTVPLWVEI